MRAHGIARNAMTIRLQARLQNRLVGTVAAFDKGSKNNQALVLVENVTHSHLLFFLQLVFQKQIADMFHLANRRAQFAEVTPQITHFQLQLVQVFLTR